MGYGDDFNTCIACTYQIEGYSYARRTTMPDHRDHRDPQDTAFEAEHWLAWLFGAGAILLGLLGLLRAFGIYGPQNTTAAGQVTSISPGGLPDTYWDGGLLMLAGLAAAFL